MLSILIKTVFQADNQILKVYDFIHCILLPISNFYRRVLDLENLKENHLNFSFAISFFLNTWTKKILTILYSSLRKQIRELVPRPMMGSYGVCHYSCIVSLLCTL